MLKWIKKKLYSSESFYGNGERMKAVNSGYKLCPVCQYLQDNENEKCKNPNIKCGYSFKKALNKPWNPLDDRMKGVNI